MREISWINQPISRTCEVLEPDYGCKQYCEAETTHAYQANRRGWMALCARHAVNHPEATPIAELLKRGEVLLNEQADAQPK